ncbi:MAG TPA: UvrD-helicase domain-containing protein [Haploplasma sp.]|nr:UvrD-helicase domain-containing protein [Haploplasma sp.]
MIDKFTKELNSLNDNQRQAVVHLDGPLFVVAGAGTGKTKALTTRIGYLIREVKVDPNRILAVTFTNKAAREIKERVNGMIAPYEVGSWLYTFHAFGLRILREFAPELNLGYKVSFTVIDTDDSLSIIRDLLKKYNIDSKQYPARMVRNVISSHKTGIEVIEDPIISKLYDGYHKELIKEQLMDFDDLIIYPYHLLRDNIGVRTNLQNRFDHILVDEFQDTDLIQYEIIKLLNCDNTFVVGDPDQSIYAFRGARYENNQLFLKDFYAQQVILDKNYRSTNNILKAANKLIKNNKSRTAGKNLVSDLGDGLPVIIKVAASDYDEANMVVNEIANLTMQNYDYSDIAILYRANHLSRLFEHGLTQNHIPYIIYGGLSYYERKEVKDILAYLHLIVDPDTNFYIKRIINVPARGVGDVTFGKLEDYSNQTGMSILDSISMLSFSKRINDNLTEFKDLILNIRARINELEDLVDVIDLVFNNSGYAMMLLESKDERHVERKENIMELKNVFRRGSWAYEGTNLEKIKSVLDEIALFTDHDTDVKSDNVVKLATVHQVKGLEFKVVFVVGMEEGLFPSERVYGNEFETEEERRIFYVALTRAKERLYITHSQRRMLYGSLKNNYQSMFVDEISEPVEKPVRRNYEESKPKVVSNNLTFGEADLVSHDVFGDGVIVSISGDILTIAFSHEHGIKKLLKTHPAIKKK